MSWQQDGRECRGLGQLAKFGGLKTLTLLRKATVLERLPIVFDAGAGPDPQRVAELEQLLGRLPSF